MVIAELRNVSKSYGPTKALDQCNLTLHSGQLLALLGPNGAGKTTAVKMLLGLLKPDSGQARVYGHDPRQQAGRARTGAMLQSAQATESLKIHELLNLFRSYYPNPMSAHEALQKAGLEAHENRLFSQLSGGQRQRVMFALAICGNPQLLVLDEPTAALDVESRRGLWRHIRAFVSQGGSVLLTTHDLEEADQLADRVALITAGRVLAEGAPADIKEHLGAKRIRCSTTQDPTGWPGVLTVRKDGIHTEILASNADDVLAQLFRRDPAVSNLEVSSPRLEEAVLALTNQKEAVPA